MNKKIAVLALSLCMIAAIAVTGTIAYFTDTDKADNVFTFGNVQIVQNEYQRGVDPENTSEPALVDFVDNKVLYPIVGSAQGAKDDFGMPVAKNYGDKIVTVENTGLSDAYVRTFILVPYPLVVKGPDLSESPLHTNLGNRVDLDGNGAYNSEYAEGWYWMSEYVSSDDDRFVTINGINYEVEVLVHTERISPNTETRPAIAGVYLDNDIDYNGTNYVKGETVLANFSDNGKVHVYAYTQAVQADGFSTANEAFTAAGLNDANGKPAITFLESVEWN